MTTFLSWHGRPAMIRGNEARAVFERGAPEWESTEAAGVDHLAIVREGISIGQARFVDLFADWNLPELPGWYSSGTGPFDSYRNARRWAHR